MNAVDFPNLALCATQYLYDGGKVAIPAVVDKVISRACYHHAPEEIKEAERFVVSAQTIGCSILDICYMSCVTGSAADTTARVLHSLLHAIHELD
jgi:predicted kinase